ncbi:MAG TPA: hypothetical protein VKP30_31505 [Polyangiaceae bacterium]|nr:hypothetical protein [Polyangiaceae bacterium]
MNVVLVVIAMALALSMHACSRCSGGDADDQADASTAKSHAPPSAKAKKERVRSYLSSE